jgi:undecaprenyl-diphosphatase
MAEVTKDDRLTLIECAVLAGVSALFAMLMNKRFARRKPAEPLPTGPTGDKLAVVLEKSTPEEKAKAEPARQALDQATAQIDSPEKADRAAEKLEELAGSATTGEVEQARQPAMPARVSDKVAEKSQRIEQAVDSASPDEKAAKGITQAAKEITASPGRERAALAEATQETLNPDQEGAPDAVHPRQREYLREAVLKRMKPFDALDAGLFLTVNHLPHNLWLNGFFSFFTIIFTGGLSWYLTMVMETFLDPRRGSRAMRNCILPLSVASTIVEYPIKAFFRRRRPFIDFVQAIVIGKKPGSWSFPSGHSAAAFAGASLLSRDFPRERPLFFLLAALVGFSRIYLGDHYPGDVLSGTLSGITIAEIVLRAQRVVLPE